MNYSGRKKRRNRMESRRWKDNSRILWNVLRHPERMEPDERMVQLEERSYRICYWILYYVILVWAVFPKRSGLFSENGELYHMILIGISLIAMLVENGRFLYRCYHGIQGNKSGGSGMLNFWMNGLLAGFFWVLLAITVWGLGGWVNRLIYWLGVFSYFLLCHLAYYHYALEAEDDDPALLKKTKSVKRLFIILAVIYYVGMIGCDLVALCYRSQFTLQSIMC